MTVTGLDGGDAVPPPWGVQLAVTVQVPASAGQPRPFPPHRILRLQPSAWIGNELEVLGLTGVGDGRGVASWTNALVSLQSDPGMNCTRKVADVPTGTGAVSSTVSSGLVGTGVGLEDVEDVEVGVMLGAVEGVATATYGVAAWLGVALGEGTEATVVYQAAPRIRARKR